jgi:tetratricopeptide (TPR) repeat protein
MKYILSLILFSFVHVQAQTSRLEEAKKIFESPKSQNKYEIITYQLWLGKYYFAAVPFAKMYLHESDELSPEFEEVIKNLILKTGTENFTDLSYTLLNRFNSPSLNFIAALKYYNEGKHQSAFEIFTKIKDDDRFYPEAQMMIGSILAFKEKYEEAYLAYDKCHKSAQNFEKLAPKEKIERYYEVMKESCLIHQARFEFKRKRYLDAIKKYELISKNSYRWPYLLMEKAWAHYYLEDFNRSLGLLVTYKSPLLESYFFPETEVLAALSYYRMCLWDDADVVVDNYYKVYQPSSKDLQSILSKHKNSDSFFLELVLQPVEITERDHPYIRHLVTQIRKKIKFNIHLTNHKRAKNEILYLEDLPKSKFKTAMMNELNIVINEQKKRMNHFIKTEMFNFINEIHKHSYSMFNLKLELLYKKRELLYKNKELTASSGKRGSLENVKSGKIKQYYEFVGEFWADELGDYSFGLQSQCELKDIKPVDESTTKKDGKEG